MPRTLPWLAAGGKVKREQNSPAPAAQTKRTSTSRTKNRAPIWKETTVSGKDFLRSSPSPPTSPIQRCPSEEFLQEGLDKDDIYMMVEDEFYTVAQTFTRHLHYAEFVRLKKEAKLRNAATIADIARPTDGITPVSAELKKKTAAEQLRMRQMEGIDAALGKQDQEEVGDELENDDAWAGTHLQNLMLSPRRVRSLVGLQGIRSSTRAAQGFVQSSSSLSGSGRHLGNGGGGSVNDIVENERASSTAPESTDDDDLDAGVRPTSPTVARRNKHALETGSAQQATPDSSRLALEKDNSQIRPSPALETANQAQRPEEKYELLKRPGISDSGRRESLGTRQPLTTTQKSSAPPRAETSHRPGPTMLHTNEEHPHEGLRKEQKGTKPKDVTRRQVQPKRRLIFDDMDELPESPKPNIQNERRRPLSTNSQHKKRKEDTGSKRSRLHEVPTFLI
ncbi:hypothetical protein BDV18DRAFT_135884 [Aspergillus unguis]